MQPDCLQIAAPAAYASDGAKLIEAYDLVFRYQGRTEPVLRYCSISRSGPATGFCSKAHRAAASQRWSDL
jgi:hypothetical protein